MPDAMTHPTPQQLRAYGLGKLSEPARAAVARHLEGCAPCRQAVASLPPDSFIEKVRAAAPGAPPPDVPPELASHSKFHILRELGRGGMGVVYQARQTVMDRQVVIKVINKALLDRPDALERFRREVQAAAKLAHPNIVTAYDAEQAGDLHFLVMEFVPGRSLAEVLQKKGPLPIAQACHYARQVALGLQHAHDRGMVHRDIKPQNLMLTPQGQVKVLDFGLAKLASERGASRGLTATGAYMGTPEYSAPEQATDAHSADIRADIYSLGCTLYCLLAGRPPFQEDTAVKTILAHLEKEPVPLPELRPDVPAALWAVVARLLAKDPARRYQTPAEAAQALAPFARPGAKGMPATRTVPPEAAPGRATRPGDDTSPRQGPGKGVSNDTPAPSATPGTAKKRAAGKPASAAWWACLPVLVAAGAVLLTVAGAAWWVSWVVLKARTAGGGAATGPEPAPVTADGFVPLFNGKDLTGWRTHPIGKARWEVQDGVLVGSGDTGHLFYVANNYENFHLRVETMINDGGNSGVFFRTPFGPSTREGYPTEGYEAQINSTHRDPRKTGSLLMHGNAGVHLPASPVPPGEWFTLEVLADGPHLVVKVNGQATADYIDAAPHSQIGQVALQVLDAATVVKFRKVEIKEYPPGDRRLRWAHGRGRFDQVKGSVWIEHIDGRHLFWREVARDENLVRLQAPNLGPTWVDLHRDAYYVRNGDGPWNRIFTGTWKVRERPSPPEKATAGPGGDWVPLFSGRDLTGWDTVGNDKASWTFEGGALVGRSNGPAPSLLVTRRADYDHFHLRGEATLSEGAKGWVLLRCGPPEDGPGGYQCYGVRLGGTRDAPEATGALFLVAHLTAEASLSAAPKFARKPGEWFPLEVIAEGNRLRVLIDGKTVVDYVDRNETFTAGRLGLYCLGNSVVRFRNLEIRELPPPAEGRPDVGAASGSGFVPLFNGLDLTGWQVHPPGNGRWEVSNGILACRGGPHSYLFTERDDYQDFRLRVEARINRVGDSGLFFWSEPAGAGFPVGYEVQLIGSHHGDDTGSLFEFAPGLQVRASAGPGLMAPDEWFTQEVVTVGNRIKVVVNGKTAVDTTLWVKKRARGRLALQHCTPETVVEFRKVEVEELLPAKPK